MPGTKRSLRLLQHSRRTTPLRACRAFAWRAYLMARRSAAAYRYPSMAPAPLNGKAFDGPPNERWFHWPGWSSTAAFGLRRPLTLTAKPAPHLSACIEKKNENSRNKRDRYRVGQHSLRQF